MTDQEVRAEQRELTYRRLKEALPLMLCDSPAGRSVVEVNRVLEFLRNEPNSVSTPLRDDKRVDELGQIIIGLKKALDLAVKKLEELR